MVRPSPCGLIAHGCASAKRRSTASFTNTLTALLGIRTRYHDECHNFFDDRISAHQRMAVQDTHQRIVPIPRLFFFLFISTKSATLQFCSVALSFK